MDPLSQAVLGASLSQSFANGVSRDKKVEKSNLLSALVIGGLAAMVPDLDVLIRSEENPILFLEFHRQFTHSLAFIPFGALICALVFYPVIHSKWLKADLSFKQIYLFSFLAYATHGLLDSCTSYGTQLFWPFSTMRIAWNIVSIIDPLFTFPMLILVFLSAKYRRVVYARIAFIYAVIFLSLGIIQNDRAEKAVYQLAEKRGHQLVRVQVKPSFGNRHVWKTIYEYDDRYYVDAVKLLLDSEIISGSSIQKLDVKRDFPWLPANSQQAKDIERFRWFSDDYLALSPDDPNMVMDVRYSYLPNHIKMMWGVGVDRQSIEEGSYDSHVSYKINGRPGRERFKRFFEMLF